MIRYKALATLYIASLLQVNRAQINWYGGYSDYGSYYVPYAQESATSTGPIRYVPVQGPPPGNNAPTYPPQNTATSPSFEQYPQNGPYPPNEPFIPAYPPNGPYPPNAPYNSPIYSNTPTVSYQGLDEANALRSAYPNQPIIIINNGGNGDTGGNSNNGNNNGRGSDDGLNLGDLAAIFLATKHHNGKEGRGGAPRPEGPETSFPPPPVVPSQGINSNFNNNNANNAGTDGRGSNKSSTIINIIITLPNSSSSISMEEKKKKKRNNKKQKKKRKDDDEDKEDDKTIEDKDSDDDDDE